MASGVSTINVLFHIGFRVRKLGGTRRHATNRSVKGYWTCRVTLAFGTSAHRLKFYAFLSVLFMFSSIGIFGDDNFADDDEVNYVYAYLKLFISSLIK